MKCAARRCSILFEIFQLRRRLVLLGRPERAVLADVVILLADADVMVAFRAVVIEPHRIALATISLENRPGTRQGIVDGGDLVVQKIVVGLVEIDALLHQGLVVLVQRNAAGIEGARTLETAGLDLEQVETAAAVLIDPVADRVARESRLALL